MVKFGRHLQFFLENEHKGSELYVVPYNKVRNFIGGDQDAEGHDGPRQREDENETSFIEEWRTCLHRASADFYSATTRLWRRVFDAISALPESRGAVPDLALRLYGTVATDEEARELLALVRQIHSTALTNAEALRKLVKKYDKDVESHGVDGAVDDMDGDGIGESRDSEEDGTPKRLSPILLPEVYAANFTVGQPTLEAGMNILRAHLHLDEDGDVDEHDLIEEHDEPREELQSYVRPRLASLHEEIVEARKNELDWLRSMVASIAPSEIAHIVAHRGFHSPHDRSDRRPLENSLSAYEAAWTNGVHLCECDIALTLDEKLVLAHDEDFSRLALDPDSPASNVKVQDMTFRQLIALPLKSGSRPPLLFDVLRAAHAIGGDSRLIVEIKPGNAEAGSALARMFLRHPELMAHCAVVMSFDAFAMHNLRRELALVLQQSSSATAGQLSGCVSLPTSMSIGNFAGRSHPTALDSLAVCSPVKEFRHSDSSEQYGFGLSESFNRKDSFNFTPFNSHKLSSSIDARSPPLPPKPKGNAQALRNAATTAATAPKLILLTVADPPKIPCELWVDVADLSPVDAWLHGGDGSLDGVYLQFQREMMTSEGAQSLRALADRWDVGVWGHNGRDPDDFETFHWLVRECGVSYVNSDLPRGFKKGILRRGVSTIK